VKVSHSTSYICHEGEAEPPWEGMGGKDILAKISPGKVFGDDTDISTSVHAVHLDLRR
jgi:hypothetical protein